MRSSVIAAGSLSEPATPPNHQASIPARRAGWFGFTFALPQGNPDVAGQAFRSVRVGGVTVLIGQPAIGVEGHFSIYDVTQFEHTVLGSNLGSAIPALHIPLLALLSLHGKLNLADMVTHRFPLDAINEAVATAASGMAGWVVVELQG